MAASIFWSSMSEVAVSRSSLRLRNRSLVIWAARLLVVVLIVGFWQIGVDNRWLPRISFGTPRTILDQLIVWLQTPQIVYHVFLTLLEASLGFLLGAGLAVLIVAGFIFSSTFERATMPLLSMLNAIPRMALGPLYIVWFGFDLAPKIILVATVVFFIVVFNLQSGLHTVSRSLLSNLRVLGAGRVEMARYFYIPALFGWFVAGIRTSIGFAFAAAIVGEYIGSTAGLGYLISFGLARYRPEETYAGIILVLVLVILIDYGLSLLERRLGHWALSREALD
jgi:NitT/TauT family transport system permease protein